MEATRASASPRPRDTKAGPNPPEVWHSRELHDRESQAAGNSGELPALRSKSLVRQKVGQEAELQERQAPIALILTHPPTSGPTSPCPEGRCPGQLPRDSARRASAAPGHGGNCSSAAPRARQPRASDTKTGLQIPPRPRPEPPSRPARQH